MGMSPTESLKLRKTDGSCCRKEYDLPVFVHGSITVLKVEEELSTIDEVESRKKLDE